MKKKYTVEITETLQRRVEVLAEDKEDALDIVREQYRGEEIVLDASDFVDVNINIIC